MEADMPLSFQAKTDRIDLRASPAAKALLKEFVY
jgi:hypothetical protein